MSFDPQFLDQLFNRIEGETTDFKQAQYDFSSGDPKEQKRKRAEFVKDIVAMYNTPRSEPAYVVLGVRKNLDGTFEVTGVAAHIDDAELQGKFADWVHPIPRFHYEPVEYRGRQVAIISIPTDQQNGPCLPLKDLPSGEQQVLRQHQLYIRRGSVNSIASREEQKTVHAWFRGDSYTAPPHDGPWDAFLEQAGGFSTDYYLGLVASPLGSDSDNVTAHLASVDWSFVVDFDRTTDTTGLLSRCRAELDSRRKVHVVTKGDAPSLNISRGTYWYCANGFAGRSETIPKSDSWVDWNKMYGVELPGFINSLAAMTAARPIVIVALWTEQSSIDYLAVVLSSAMAAFGDALNIVLVTPGDPAPLAQLGARFECQAFGIPLPQLCSGLRAHMQSRTPFATTEITLPSSSGAPVVVPMSKASWLLEEMQLIHLGEGRHAGGALTPGSEFLRGNQITWYDLGLTYDVVRELTTKAEKTVRQDLLCRRPLRVNLYHAPGAGGTTIARRIIWDLHNEFPCLLLDRTKPQETCERLAYVSSLTGKAILLVVDAGAITDREADLLYEHIASSHIPVVLLQVIRKHTKPTEQKRALYVDSQLEPVEAERFVHFLEREVPTRKAELRHVLAAALPKTLTPFYLALVAFGRDFIRLSDYVTARVSGLTAVQIRCVVYFSIAHLYGQRSIPVQMFTDLFGSPAGRPVKLDQLIPPACLELLVETEAGHWRTVHALVAEECMRHLLTSPGTDPDAWLQRLSHWSLQFIDMCRADVPIPSEDALDLVRRVFVFRDNSEILGSERAGTSHFSELIEAIPSAEGRLEVLKRLTERFPDEAHFWAHLGRFYSTVLKEHEKGLEAVEHSISLQPFDHVLHHMKGMALRALVYQQIAEKMGLEGIVTHAEAAAEAFARARALDPEDEHGYISEAQMVLRVLDYCGQVQKAKPIVAASSATSPKWIRESIQSVEDLLAQVRQNREGEQPSPYEDGCRASLDLVYGDHSTALSRWDNLLSRNDVFHPPIRRQIVWAYLSRHDRDWAKLSRSELARSIKLLSENLDEEPNNERNLRLWLQAIRATEQPPSLDAVIEKLAYWHANSDSLEPVYYLFVMYGLKAFEGSSLARDKAGRCLEECRVRSRYRRNRTKSFEWIGIGDGLRRLIHQDALGEWNRDKQFWSDASSLARIHGVIKRIQGPESGEIETESGLGAFFVPGRTGHFKGESENRRVSFFVGFSHDGLRAWEVENI